MKQKFKNCPSIRFGCVEIYPLIMILGLFLLLSNSCKKDADSNKNNTAIPTLEWVSTRTFHYDRDAVGPSGPFTISRDFKSTGHPGNIEFNIQVIEISTNKVVSQTNKTFSVDTNHTYTFNLQGNGGMSITTCWGCTGTVGNYKIKITSLTGGETWETTLGVCQSNSSCSTIKTDKCFWSTVSIINVQI